MKLSVSNLFLVSCLLLAALQTLAQSGRVKAEITAPDTRPAQVLYDEANNYVTKKYEEFNARKVAFDPKLDIERAKD